ncbi:glycine--tRNA ligase subunit beta [Candidatus Pelagibacter sp. HIMB1483]|uniref:glycine--tRNA ligase subunit beta n=1 Tax=Candidatus Pelagibacter sp. HIMB1483 TaxID=3415414 RepID=UPI003F86820C
MSEFFLELFSEEIPASLQKNLREKIFDDFNNLFERKFIKSKKSFSISSPNRLVIVFEGLDKEIKIKSEEIKGPKINAPDQALEGFLRSNNVEKKDLSKKKTEKGEFYFYKTKTKTIRTHDLLVEFIPRILGNYQWKKSMKWGEFDLNWGRPLKSILSVFDKKILNFEFHHLVSSNSTFIDKDLEEKKKSFENFKKYEKFFEKQKIYINQNKRLKIIEQSFSKLLKKKKLKINENPKLIDEVVNLVDNPNILLCEFDKKFLSVPKEILILTMETHQKYFPTFNDKNEITNEFLIVTNKKDLNGLIKIGNERVVEARLSDAEFFWNKDKTQNLVKKVSELKSMNFFKGLGTYFDKVQRMRKLGGMISDELMISKEKVELSASICKTDLTSDLVNEFPELQGLMGGYFSTYQGFDKDISLAITEQYLPIGLYSKVPKKAFSVALSITDKIDTMVGFFGINEKPTSSKDPFALRRTALGVIRTVIENKKDLKLNDIIKYSSSLYNDQGNKLTNINLQLELHNFLKDRFRYYLKEKEIRYDIIEASISSLSLNKIFSSYEKARQLNKIINSQQGVDIISSYKRASNILESEMRNNEIEINNTTDPGIFKSDFEKNLYKKIRDIKKYYSTINNDENFEKSLLILADTRKVVFEFFDNVKVNEENETLRKNRLELINMLCKTFQNFINFQLLKASNE